MCASINPDIDDYICGQCSARGQRACGLGPRGSCNEFDPNGCENGAGSGGLNTHGMFPAEDLGNDGCTPEHPCSKG